MAFLNLFFKAEGLKETKARLKKLQGKLGTKGFSPVRRTLVTQLLKMADKKLAQSARGSLPRDWDALSPITVFIRRNRATRKNKRPQVGVDSGIMRLSTRPFEKRGGKQFGIENRLKRARVFNFGGLSGSSTVNIGRFNRRTPSGGTTRVRAFTMRISGGHKIPARPFFPTLREFGPVVKKILKDAERRIAKGK